MSDIEWNEVQNFVLSQLFISDSDSVSLKTILSSLNYRSGVFRKMYSIVGNAIDDNDENFSLLDMRVINYKDGKYLVLRYGIWDFIIINLETYDVLDYEEGILLVKEVLFNKIKGITEEDLDFLFFEIIDPNVAKEIVEFYIEENEIFDSSKCLEYNFYNNYGISADVVVKFDDLSVTVGINDINSGRCNYVFLDNDLKATGASNLTGNKDDIGNLFNGNRDILIPIDLLNDINLDIEQREISNGNSFSFNK